MSWARITYLYCDGEKCPRLTAAYDCAPSPESRENKGATYTKQRKEAAKHDGWVIRGKLDYCAECAVRLGMRPQSHIDSLPVF